MFARDAYFIGGRWAEPASQSLIEVISPTTEEPVGRVPDGTPADIDAAVAAARAAFEEGPWPRMSVKERGQYLLQMVEFLGRRLEEAVNLQIDEMGSPYSFARPTNAGVLASVEHDIDVAASIELREIRDGAVGKILVIREPIGVVAGIIPWNAPLPLVLSKFVPAALTGCPIVIKPAPETPLSAYLVADAAAAVGLPDGVLNIVAGGRETGEHLVRHPGVDRVSFTGSSLAGSRIGALCGEQLKRVTLELGGKSAAVVLPDADLDRDLGTLIASSMPNNGQVCYATTRILAPSSRTPELVERLVSAVSAMKVGDPHDPDTAFGPLVAERQRDRVEGYIAAGRQAGATVALGGGRPASQPKGWFVEPTIFVNVSNAMTIAREEIFGPVVSVIEYGTEDEAVAIANDSEYGLGGAVFTADIEHGLEVAARIKTGTCRVNEAPPGGGGGPFGGVKRSGVGREHAREGYETYFELKSVSLPSGFTPSAGVPIG
jgi:aldehyde dehydrogenase (NAD+)